MFSLVSAGAIGVTGSSPFALYLNIPTVAFSPSQIWSSHILLLDIWLFILYHRGIKSKLCRFLSVRKGCDV